ncbi:hypothetical protein AMTR_s00083p00177310 [Amborella trichopoda]|uniref:Uncharacterized protein n=1 Tax=Amborella trichopoda TaxID=13333 RepID=W1P4G7_AMBTC|nr:hypothetical protein AMTR_s00083p00177310 [Amborella trichopoda]
MGEIKQRKKREEGETMARPSVEEDREDWRKKKLKGEKEVRWQLSRRSRKREKIGEEEKGGRKRARRQLSCRSGKREDRRRRRRRRRETTVELREKAQAATLGEEREGEKDGRARWRLKLATPRKGSGRHSKRRELR